MEPLHTDLSILSKFNFEKAPVGVKFLLGKPEGIKQLDKKMPVCKMIREAQERDTPFYMTKDNEDCFGAVTLGMVETPPFAEAGQIGVELSIFKEARANSRIYNYLPKIRRGIVNYVAFAKLDKLTFDPDLLILMATVSQAEVLLRALDHLSGGPRESKTTGVFSCAWLFTYPYQTGKVNFTVTGLHFGSKAKQAFPEGLILICVPFDWIPILIHGLKEMNWELPGYKMGAEKFVEWENKMLERLAKESQNP
jgi:uncharacterized protein (DUF169 family)